MVNEMRNEQIKKIAFTGIIIGLIIVMSFTMLGFITIASGASITLVHIPVLIGAMVLGKKYGAVLGLIFGLCSLILAFMNVATNAPFTNPIVSILPRVAFGFLIVPLYNFIKKLIKNDIASTALTMCLSTLIHTIIVLVPMYIAWVTDFYFGVADYTAQYGDGTGTNLFAIIFGILLANGLIEILLAGVIGTPIAMAMKVVIKQNKIEE